MNVRRLQSVDAQAMDALAEVLIDCVEGGASVSFMAPLDHERELGRTLLVLDTVTDSPAYRLYERPGWKRVGEIPRYALWPDGRACPTTYFYRDLA